MFIYTRAMSSTILTNRFSQLLLLDLGPAELALPLRHIGLYR